MANEILELKMAEMLEGFIEEVRKGKNKYCKEMWPYLILTGKFENQFRDLFSYYLQEKLDETSYVARDYVPAGEKFKKGQKRKIKKADIAILDKNGSLQKVVELKAAYSFDAKKKTRAGKKSYLELFKNKLKTDLKRWGNIPKIGILLVTNIKSLEPYNSEDLKNLRLRWLKYAKEIVGYGKNGNGEYGKFKKGLLDRFKLEFNGIDTFYLDVYCYSLDEKSLNLYVLK